MESDERQVIPCENRGLIIDPSKGKHVCTLIWLHGLGDSAEGFRDFFTASNSPAPADARVRLLTAPRAKVTANNYRYFNSWYDIATFDDLEKESVGMEEVIANSIEIKKVIEEEVKLLGGDYKKIAIGGFSQGCAMSLHVGLSYGDKLGCIIGLSGYLFPSTELQEKNPPILLVHGTDDETIPLSSAMYLYGRDDFIKREGVKFEKIGGMEHEIFPEVIEHVFDALLNWRLSLNPQEPTTK